MNDFNPDKVLQDQLNPVKEVQLDIQKKNPLPTSKRLNFKLPDDGSSRFLGGAPQRDLVQKSSLTREVPISEAYDMVGGDWMAKYPTYQFGADNAEYAAQTQTTWDKVSNGLLKWGGKTLNAIVGGTAGVVYGLGASVSDGKLSSLYDNNFSNWLSDLDSKLNYQLPNYYTAQEKELGLGGQMLTTNFWADKFLGGLSFTTGALLSEGIWAWATGGASLASSGARLGAKLARVGRWGAEATEDTAKLLQGMSKYKSLLKEIPSTAVDLSDASRMVKYANVGRMFGQGGNIIRFTATSAGYEASVEALQFRKEAEEKFFNREAPPTPEETAEFYKNLESASNGVFLTNMAIVGSSNLLMLGNVFNLKSPIKLGVSDFIQRKAFGLGVDKATKEVIKQTGKQKAGKIAYEYFLKPSVTEGLFEEGFQGVTNKVANKWIEHTYDPKKSMDSFDTMGSIYEAMEEQYGSKEGWVENGLGMLIGIVGGSINARAGIKEQENKLQYQSAVLKSFDQESLQGNLIIPQRLKMMNQINGFNQEAQVEAKKGNLVRSQLAQNDALLSYINAKTTLGDSVSDITKEVENALNSVSAEQWKDANITNVEEYKKETISEFERIAKAYERNKTFWSYIVGRKLVGEQNLDSGVLDISFGQKATPNQMMIESLTWASVRGENASKYMNDIKEVLGKELGTEVDKTIGTLNKLNGATGGLKTNLSKNLKLHEALLKERDVLEKAILTLQSAPKETEGQATQQIQYSNLANKLVGVNEKIQNIQNALEETANKIAQTKQYEQNLSGISLEGNLAEQKITANDLVNLKDNIQKLKDTLSFISETEPQRGEYLNDLIKEYQDANDIFLMHQASIRMAQKAKLSDINTWVGAKFLKKNKEMDVDSLEWFNEVARAYQNAKAGLINNNRQEETTTTEEEIVEEKEPTSSNDITPVVEQKVEEPKLIDEYRKRIEQLYKGKYDLARYLGDNVGELSKEKPSPQDIERYRELSKQPEETQELVDLRNKLQNWKLLDTAIDDNGMSIAEMIDIVNQQDMEVEKADTKEEVTTQDVEETLMNASEDKADNSLLQNQNGSVTAKLTVLGDIRFSHIKLSNIAERFGGEIIDEEGNKKTAEEIDEITKSLKEGETRVFTIKGLKFKLDDKGRISMRYNDFIPNQDALNLYLLNPNSTKWTYKNIYEFNGVDVVKVKSDFQEAIQTKDILESKEQDDVQLVIFSEDGYNDSIKGLPEKDFKKKLKIMVVRNGKNIGVLKAGTEETEQVLLNIREQAYKEFKKGNKTKVVGKTKIEKVFLGTPAIKMNQSGEVVNIPITKEANTMIKATGFMEGENITTNITIPENTLNTSFVKTEEGKKSPFIVFQVGSQMVAYPVTMAKTQDSKLVELENVIGRGSVQEQAIAVNNLIQEFGIETEKVFPETLESRLEELKKAFDEHTTFVSAEQFAAKEYNTENIPNDALINIDLEDEVFADPKVKISLDAEDFKVLVSSDFKNLSKTEIENQLSDIAVELDRDYRVNSDTKYLYAKGSKVGQIIEDVKYTNTFDDTPTSKPTSQLDKIRNMNILREALSERLPFEIKQIIGEEKLKEIDKMFKTYDNIIKKQLEVDKEQEENGNDKICPQ